MFRINRLSKFLYFFITTLIVMAPALYNRYPLVYFDSGVYMEMAVNLEPSFHRSFGYPWLMRITGWLISNWPVVFFQSLLVNALLFRLTSLSVERKLYSTHFTTVSLLAFGTSLSWYAAQIMPDVFTMILALATGALILERRLTVFKGACYGLICFISAICHLSHIPLVFLVLGTLLFMSRWIAISDLKIKEIVMAASLGLAVLTICIHNAAHGHGFRMSLASNVFLSASIAEMGFLKLYLDENCPNAPNELCAIKDELPRETGGFLWASDGPVQSAGPDWSKLNREWQPVVSDFLTKPRYLKWFLFGAVKSTFQQMFQIELGSGLQYTYGEGTSPSWPMRTHFQQELNEYLTSVQNKNADDLPLGFFKGVNYITLLLAILIVGRAVLLGQLNARLVVLLTVFVLFYFYNAAITGVLANVYERLQCRLLPLFTLLAILTNAQNFDFQLFRRLKE